MSCHTLSPDRNPSCTQINHSCASQPLSDGTSQSTQIELGGSVRVVTQKFDHGVSAVFRWLAESLLP
jgi:hypothetical protein